MFPYVGLGRNILLPLVCVMLAMPLHESAAMDPRFELDSKTLGVVEPPKKTPSPAAVSPKKTRRKKVSSAAAPNGSVHIVKAGDNIFKILMRDYGFSNHQAEMAIDKICQENNIADIRRLKVGHKIVIPSLQRAQEESASNTAPLADTAHQAVNRMNMRLQAPDAALSELESSVQFRNVWEKIVPSGPGRPSADILNDPSFSLTLDPQRYPTYATMDGGRILVDKNDSIPPLVKALIVEKNPSVRIVSESPAQGKRFLKEMLGSAGFYSVAEGFSMDFGTDPQLTIRSDFKVEKSAESVIKFDMLLMNAGRTAYPKVIKDFLNNEGVTAYEPFALSKPAATVQRGQFYQITSADQTAIVDALLTSLSIAPERNRRLDVFSTDDNGISLSVKAERYFERNGQRHVITRFDGDPVKYTLFRILETKGYQTVILDNRDNFRTVTEKLLAGMRIPAAYSRHKLDFDPEANYALQMSGFKLDGSGLPGSDLFLTNLEMDRVVRELLQESGYQITVK